MKTTKDNKSKIGHGWFSITQAKKTGASIHISSASGYPVTVSEISAKKPESYTDFVSVGKVYLESLSDHPKYPKPKTHDNGSKNSYYNTFYKNVAYTKNYEWYNILQD